MPITYDITQDDLYLEGLEKGLLRGEEHKRRMILNAIQMNIMTIEQIAAMAEVDIAYVLQLLEENNNSTKN